MEQGIDSVGTVWVNRLIGCVLSNDKDKKGEEQLK